MITEEESALLDAVASMFDGLATYTPKSNKKATDDNNFDTKSAQYIATHLEDSFRSKAVDLTHYDGICSRFAKVLKGRKISDPEFKQSFEIEMSGIGVPEAEKLKAMKIVDTLIKDQDDDIGNGWNPNLKEIIKVSKPGEE